MNGLSFLVSPQMQDVQQSLSRAQQDAYDREISGQQAAAQQQAALERTETMQKAAEARLQQQESLRLQMQAQLFDHQAKTTEQQTSRQYTLADVAQARKDWSDQRSVIQKQLQDIQANPQKYDAKWAQNYTQNAYGALSRDDQRMNVGMDSFLHNAKEGDSITRYVDFNSFETPKLFQATQANPDVIDAMQAKTQNINSLMESRGLLSPLRAQLLQQKIKQGVVGPQEKRIVDGVAGYSSQVAALTQQYQDRVRQDGNATYADAVIAPDLNKARSSLAAMQGELQGAITQGRIPQNFLTGGDSGQQQQAPQDQSSMPSSAPAPGIQPSFLTPLHSTIDPIFSGQSSGTPQFTGGPQ